MARVKMSQEETATSYELAQPGTYEAEVMLYKEGTGPKGKYLDWAFELQGVSMNSEGLPIGPGKRVSYVHEKTTLADGKRWRLSQLAVAAGLPGDDFDYDEILRKRVRVEVDVKKDEGFPAKNVVVKFLKA